MRRIEKRALFLLRIFGAILGLRIRNTNYHRYILITYSLVDFYTHNVYIDVKEVNYMYLEQKG